VLSLFTFLSSTALAFARSYISFSNFFSTSFLTSSSIFQNTVKGSFDQTFISTSSIIISRMFFSLVNEYLIYVFQVSLCAFSYLFIASRVMNAVTKKTLLSSENPMIFEYLPKLFKSSYTFD